MKANVLGLTGGYIPLFARKGLSKRL